MAYICLGGDLQLGFLMKQESSPTMVEVNEDAIERAYVIAPQQLDAVNKHPSMQLSDDSMEVSVLDNVPTKVTANGVFVLANKPIPRHALWYYFEIEIIGRKSTSGFVAVGLAKGDTLCSSGFGFPKGSYLYRSDDGKVYDETTVETKGRMYGPPFGLVGGDRIGCLFDIPEGMLYYTKNDELLGEAFHGIVSSVLLYPAIGLNAPGLRVRTYLSTDKFKMPLKTIHQALAVARLSSQRNPLRLPMGLNKYVTPRGLLSADGLTILPSGSPDENSSHIDAGCILFMADRPIPSGSQYYYYETTILSLALARKGEIEIGVSTPRGPNIFTRNLAKYEHSGSISVLISSSEVCAVTHIPYKEGDVIGCIVDVLKGHVWWTRNAKLTTPPISILDKSLPLYPSIWTHGQASAAVNLGQKSFTYDIKTFISAQISATARGSTVLPGEIVLFVVKWVLILCMHRTSPPRPDTVFWQRTLASMRLTCRFWARILRPFAFRRVSLWSESQYNCFVELLEEDGSIGDMVEFVALRDPASLPWSHKVFLSPALKRLGNVEHLTLAGAQRVDLGKQRLARPPGLPGAGIFALVHRTFANIRTLTIEGAAFSAFLQLRHLLKGLPNLSMFDAQAVTWPSTQTRFEALTSDAPKLAIVRSRECTDCLLSVGVLLASPTSPRRQPSARPTAEADTNRAILACMRAFSSAWKSAIVSTWARDITAKWILNVAHWNVEVNSDIMGLQPHITDVTGLEDKVLFFCDSSPQRSLMGVMFSLYIRTEPLSDAELDQIKGLAWVDIDGALCKVPTLDHCFVDLRPYFGSLVVNRGGRPTIAVPSRWGHIRDAIVHGMPQLHNQGKLTIRVQHIPSQAPMTPGRGFWEKSLEARPEQQRPETT